MPKVLSSNRKHSSGLPIQRGGSDYFTLKPPQGEAYHCCLLTLFEADSHSGARVTAQPPRGALGAQEISVEWWHGVGDKVSYQLEAFTQPVDCPPDAPSPTRQLTGFVPRQHGFHFSNAFHPSQTLRSQSRSVKSSLVMPQRVCAEGWYFARSTIFLPSAQSLLPQLHLITVCYSIASSGVC